MKWLNSWPAHLIFEHHNPAAALKVLLDHQQLNITLQRLAHELVENHLSFDNTAIIGLQPRGIYLSDRIVQLVKNITGNEHILYGKLDITFYRDDIHQGNALHIPAATEIAFSVNKMNVILIDDVLHTGRTIRAAMDALLDFGRPAQIELLTLIDRHFSRELPVQPDYVGRTIDTIMSQKVKVEWAGQGSKDEVVLID